MPDNTPTNSGDEQQVSAGGVSIGEGNPAAVEPQPPAPTMEQEIVVLEEDIPDPPKHDISLRWLREAKDPKAKKDLKEVFARSAVQFRNMRRIVQELFNESAQGEYDVTDPNFALRVAYARGYRKALTDVYNLIPTTIKTD